MEDMIKRILDVDTKARNMTSKAEQARALSLRNIPERTTKLKQEYLERANERVEKVEAAEKEAAEASFLEKASVHKEALLRLEQIFEHNKETWVNEIVKSVLEE
ncbi:MAG TPA: hypothetical protein DEQ02_07660 [Ruminococcaceae bacterium]|nr:hypothetical protein [Oscillospiraceae bacterium]